MCTYAAQPPKGGLLLLVADMLTVVGPPEGTLGGLALMVIVPENWYPLYEPVAACTGNGVIPTKKSVQTIPKISRLGFLMVDS
jgi:hypothetical protein